MREKDIDRKKAYEEKAKIGETQEAAIKDRIFADENLEEEQKYLEDYLYANAEEEIMKENLVNGALLRCQKATGRYGKLMIATFMQRQMECHICGCLEIV